MKSNRSLQQFLSFLMILLLLPVYALAQSATDQLTSSKWTCEDASIEFNADGSGVFVNHSGKSFDMAWTAQDNQVRFEYQFYGKRSETLTLAQAGGNWTLNDDDGNVFSQNGSAPVVQSNAYTAAFGEELDLGFAKVTFHRVQLMKQLHGSGQNSTYTTAANNSHYFALVGTITNTSSRTLNVSQVFGEIKLNQYIYGVTAEADHNGQLEDSISPMSTGAFYIYSTIPDTLTKIASTGEVKLAFNFDFAGTPSSFDQADFLFQYSLSSQDIANAWLPPARDMAYFKECPALPMPSSFADVSEVSNFIMSDHVRYTYKKLLIYDDEENLLQLYKDGLRSNGYAIKGSDTEFQVYSGTKKIADVSSGSFGWIQIEIPNGLSGYSSRPKQGTTATVPVETTPRVSIGGTIRLPNAKLTLEKYGTASKLYSCITPGNGRYYMYEPDAGTQFFYLHGSFNNTGGIPLDIRHVYAELIFDDTYHYDADCCGVKENASNFINTVTAQTSCKFYIFASVPPSVLNSYKTCVIKLGFTDEFAITVSSNGLPAFNHCDDVYEIKVNRR